MSDLISRQDAIDAARNAEVLISYDAEWPADVLVESVIEQTRDCERMAIESLPSRITEYKTFCGVPIEEATRIVQENNADPKTGECKTCKRCSDYLWSKGENGTRCPIEEHYVLPKDGYCHLYEQI